MLHQVSSLAQAETSAHPTGASIPDPRLYLVMALLACSPRPADRLQDTTGGPLRDLPAHCELEIRDVRSTQEATTGGHPNAVELLVHSWGAGEVDSIDATVSWYEGAVSLQLQLDPSSPQALIGPLPHAIEGHPIQDLLLEEHGSLDLQILVEASQGGIPSCSGQLSVPFSSWDRPPEQALPAGISLTRELSVELLGRSFDDQLAVLTTGSAAKGQEGQALLTSLLGDVLGIYRVDIGLVESVMSDGNQATASLNAADLRSGDLLLMTDATHDLHSAVLLGFDLLAAELVQSFDSAEFDDPLALHNKFHADPEGTLHALSWRKHKHREPQYTTNLVALTLDEETLEIVQLEELFDAESCTRDTLYDYGNSIGQGPAGYDGQQLQVATFAIDHNLENEAERSFFVAGRRGEVPRFIFVREGRATTALDDACWDVYPDLQLIELPDRPEGGPIMDFLHDAELRQLGERRYQVVTLSLGQQEQPSFVSFLELELPEVTEPSTAVTAELLCTASLDHKTASHGNLYSLPRERYDPDFSVTYVFPGKSEGPILGFSGQVAESGSCELVLAQARDRNLGPDDGPMSSDKWLEPVDVAELVRPGTLGLQLDYDLELLEANAEALELYF